MTEAQKQSLRSKPVWKLTPEERKWRRMDAGSGSILKAGEHDLTRLFGGTVPEEEYEVKGLLSNYFIHPEDIPSKAGDTVTEVNALRYKLLQRPLESDFAGTGSEKFKGKNFAEIHAEGGPKAVFPVLTKWLSRTGENPEEFLSDPRNAMLFLLPKEDKYRARLMDSIDTTVKNYNYTLQNGSTVSRRAANNAVMEGRFPTSSDGSFVDTALKAAEDINAGSADAYPLLEGIKEQTLETFKRPFDSVAEAIYGLPPSQEHLEVRSEPAGVEKVLSSAAGFIPEMVIPTSQPNNGINNILTVFGAPVRTPLKAVGKLTGSKTLAPAVEAFMTKPRSFTSSGTPVPQTQSEPSMSIATALASGADDLLKVAGKAASKGAAKGAPKAEQTLAEFILAPQKKAGKILGNDAILESLTTGLNTGTTKIPEILNNPAYLRFSPDKKPYFEGLEKLVADGLLDPNHAKILSGVNAEGRAAAKQAGIWGDATITPDSLGAKLEAPSGSKAVEGGVKPVSAPPNPLAKKPAPAPSPLSEEPFKLESEVVQGPPPKTAVQPELTFPPNPPNSAQLSALDKAKEAERLAAVKEQGGGIWDEALGPVPASKPDVSNDPILRLMGKVENAVPFLKPKGPSPLALVDDVGKATVKPAAPELPTSKSVTPENRDAKLYEDANVAPPSSVDEALKAKPATPAEETVKAQTSATTPEEAANAERVANAKAGIGLEKETTEEAGKATGDTRGKLRKALFNVPTLVGLGATLGGKVWSDWPKEVPNGPPPAPPAPPSSAGFGTGAPGQKLEVGKIYGSGNPEDAELEEIRAASRRNPAYQEGDILSVLKDKIYTGANNLMGNVKQRAEQRSSVPISAEIPGRSMDQQTGNISGDKLMQNIADAAPAEEKGPNPYLQQLSKLAHAASVGFETYNTGEDARRPWQDLQNRTDAERKQVSQERLAEIRQLYQMEDAILNHKLQQSQQLNPGQREELGIRNDTATKQQEAGIDAAWRQHNQMLASMPRERDQKTGLPLPVQFMDRPTFIKRFINGQ